MMLFGLDESGIDEVMHPFSILIDFVLDYLGRHPMIYLGV
jgi:hypothetical protein